MFMEVRLSCGMDSDFPVVPGNFEKNMVNILAIWWRLCFHISGRISHFCSQDACPWLLCRPDEVLLPLRYLFATQTRQQQNYSLLLASSLSTTLKIGIPKHPIPFPHALPSTPIQLKTIQGQYQPWFELSSYNHIIRMNNKLQDFSDSVQMLRATAPLSCTANSLISEIPHKVDTFNAKQKSCGLYQKSNNWQAESQQLGEEGRASNWTIQQQNTLVELHNSRGNKWVQIALILHKSDNEVKNRYHSKLRRGIRKINRLITDSAPHFKPLKANFISKVIQTAEDVYSHTKRTPHPQAKEAYELKNKILEIAGLPEEGCEGEEKMMLEAIERMVAFGKSYRKRGLVESAKPPVNCKYKGKEIKTLLKENEQTAFRNTVKQQERKRLRNEAKAEEEPSINEGLPSDQQQEFQQNSYQTYILFNQCVTYPSYYMPCLSTQSFDRFPTVPFLGEVGQSSMGFQPVAQGVYPSFL